MSSSLSPPHSSFHILIPAPYMAKSPREKLSFKYEVQPFYLFFCFIFFFMSRFLTLLSYFLGDFEECPVLGNNLCPICIVLLIYIPKFTLQIYSENKKSTQLDDFILKFFLIFSCALQNFDDVLVGPARVKNKRKKKRKRRKKIEIKKKSG